MFKLIVYVPESHLETVKSALFEAGAGRLGHYEHCCWQSLGQGQFRPLAGSDPFLGKVGQLETLAEYRIEILCTEVNLVAAVRALIEAHPFEEPAYDVIALSNPSVLV